LAGILFGLGLSWMIATSSLAGMADQVQEHVLPNGLKVILLENHKVPEITFQVWYRVGSRNEAWGKTGLSHMLEHMMFKGTKKVSGEAFSQAIEEIGGNDNAFTAADYTAYFENVSSDRIQVPIDLEADDQDSLFSQGMLLAKHEIAAGWRTIADFLPAVRKVTPEDIRRVAGQYLRPQNRTVGILIPLPPKPEGSGKSAPADAGRIIR
jgi:predicted Zn-dependent peptidase